MKFANFDELVKMMRGKSNKVVVPGANNFEALEACKMAQDNGLVSGGVLIGNKTAIESMAQKTGLNLSKFELVESSDLTEMCEKAVAFVKQGKGDFLVKGLVDTKFYVKAILNKSNGMVEPGKLLSHFVLFETANYHKLFALTDAGVMIAPNLEEKRQIVQNAVDLMRMLGVATPKVSVVCPVEKVNPKIPSTLDAQELSKMSSDGRIKNAVVEGPYDIYISVSRKLAEEKGVTGGKVPGEVDIMLLPNLDAANPIYKAISFFAAGIKSATLLAGASVPVILPSRTDAPLTKMLSIALASFLKEQQVKV